MARERLAFVVSNAISGRMTSIAIKALYWILVLGVALIPFIYFLRTTRFGSNPKATIEMSLTGTAYRPFAYRVLVPMTANFLSPILQRRAALRLGIEAETIVGERFFRAGMNGRLYPREVWLILIIMYLSLAGFAITMWLFVKELGYSLQIRYIAPPFLMLGATIFFRYGYLYDFTLMFLFSLSLLLMLRAQWLAYLAVFSLGTLNKETTIFLYLVFAVYFFRRMPRGRFILLSVMQLGIYALIQGTIRFVFRNNPGNTMEYHFYDQIAYSKELAAIHPGLLIYWAAAMANIAILVVHNWDNKPEFLRAALWIAPFFLALFFLLGYPTEVRDLVEVYPVVAILMFPPPTIAPNGSPYPKMYSA